MLNKLLSFCFILGLFSSFAFSQGDDPFPAGTPDSEQGESSQSDLIQKEAENSIGGSPFPQDDQGPAVQEESKTLQAPPVEQLDPKVSQQEQPSASGPTAQKPRPMQPGIIPKPMAPQANSETMPEGEEKKEAFDPKLLELPVYSLRIKNPAQGKYQIGDDIEISVEGLNIPVDKPIEARVLDGSSSLLDLGWMIRSRVKDGAMTLIASPLQPGKRTLPQLLLSEKEMSPFARTDILELEVESALNPADQEDKPIELFPPQKIAFPWFDVIMIGLLVLGVLILIVYGLVRWSRSRNPKIESNLPLKPLLPEDTWALKELERIQGKGYASQNLPKPHYFGISETLKHYFARRFSIDAQESTTHEMIRLLQGVKVEEGVVREIRELYDRLDLVKFTDTQPPIPDYKTVMEKAKAIVQRLKRKPVEPDQTQGAPEGMANAV